jgi:hypothetical protein
VKSTKEDAESLDVEAGVTKRVVKLRQRKAESAQLRGLVDDPDMVAVRIEAQRRLITRGMWFFLALGLGFTTAGVQDFLAGHRPMSDPLWWAAWLVEPMFAGVLIMLLMFEAEALAHGVAADDRWVRWLKRILLASTLFMNVYPTIAVRDGKQFEVGNLAIHLMIPLVVFGVAEVMPIIQHRMNDAIAAAYRRAATRQQTAAQAAAPAPEPAPVSAAARPAVLATASRLRLPDSVITAVRTRAAEVTAQGREFTAADVLDTVRVPADLAERIAAEVTTNNGHAFTS